MKKLLVGINSKFIHSNLAIRYIQKYGEKQGMEIHTAEYSINQSADYILDEIVVQSPDVVAFSCYLWNIDYVTRIIRILKQILPELIIVLGGPEVSYDSHQWIDDAAEVDYVVSGEGEQAVVALFEALEDQEHTTLESLKGITYRKDGKSVKNPQGQPMSMADVPFPYEHDLYGLEHRILYYETSRGCPYSCEYCLSSIEKGVRFRPLEMVYEELQFFLDRNVAQVKFVDRTFNAKKSHAMGIWQYLKTHDNGITNFHFELTADLIDDEMIEFLKTLRVGLVQFEVGVQSTNEATIVDIKRKVDFDKLKDRVKRIKEGKNIHLHLDLIAGLPKEDYKAFGRSFDDVMAIRPEQLQLGFLKVLKGSMIHRKRDEYGIIYRAFAPYEVLSTKELTYGDLRTLKQIEELMEFYYNSEQFIQSIEYVMRSFESPFSFYETFSGYWEDKGYFHQKHSRQKLFEIMDEFGEAEDKIDRRFLQSLLIHDYCSRERVKKWPAFVKAEKEMPEPVKKLYRDESIQSKLFGDYEGMSVRQIQRMTHIQAYDYDILRWTGTREVAAVSEATYVFYDYATKDPMNGTCQAYDVQVNI